MFIIIKRSGKTLTFLSIHLGVLGYADDTAVICETVNDAKEVIKIVEKFCEKEDIQLNGKKTVWMKLGENPLTHIITKKASPKPPNDDEIFVANGVAIEKVYEFKYLGYILTSNDKQQVHIDRRKQFAAMAKNDLNKIGLKNEYLRPEIKGQLIQEQVRSRLTYGLENCLMSENMVGKLESYENNIFKEYLGLSKSCYSTPILDIIKIKPLSHALAIRRYSFLRQIISNDLTNQILHSGIEHNLYTLVTQCGYENKTGDNPRERDNEISFNALCSIREIRKQHREKNMDNYTKAIEYLLNHNTRDNHKLLRFMLMAKNNIRGIT